MTPTFATTRLTEPMIASSAVTAALVKVESTEDFKSPHHMLLIDGEVIAYNPNLQTDTSFKQVMRGANGMPYISAHAVGAVVQELPYIRLYLPNSGSPEVTPAFDSSWTDTTQATRAACSNVTSGDSFGDVAVVKPTGVTTWTGLARQFVSDPLPAGALVTPWVGGTGVIRYKGDTPHSVAMRMRIVSEDGETFRDAPVQWGGGGGGLNISYYPTTFGGLLAPNLAQTGDRLVIELGYYVVNILPTTPARTLMMEFGAIEDRFLVAGVNQQLSPWLSFAWIPDLGRFRELDSPRYFRPKAPTHRPSLIAERQTHPPSSGKLNQMLGNSRRVNS